jgi:hypothetical protein
MFMGGDRDPMKGSFWVEMEKYGKETNGPRDKDKG